MVSFTKVQLELLDEFFQKSKLKDGLARLTRFNSSYKKPTKKRKPLDPSVRCRVIIKDGSRCNVHKIHDGDVCGLHLKGSYQLVKDCEPAFPTLPDNPENTPPLNEEVIPQVFTGFSADLAGFGQLADLFPGFNADFSSGGLSTYAATAATAATTAGFSTDAGLITDIGFDTDGTAADLESLYRSVDRFNAEYGPLEIHETTPLDEHQIEELIKSYFSME